MANIESQKKRNRQNEAARLRNRALRSELKTRARNAVEAAEAGDSAAAETALREAQQRIDMAVSKGLLQGRDVGDMGEQPQFDLGIVEGQEDGAFWCNKRLPDPAAFFGADRDVL